MLMKTLITIRTNLSSFHLNAHPQTQKLEPPCVLYTLQYFILSWYCSVLFISVQWVLQYRLLQNHLVHCALQNKTAQYLSVQFSGYFRVSSIDSKVRTTLYTVHYTKALLSAFHFN